LNNPVVVTSVDFIGRHLHAVNTTKACTSQRTRESKADNLGRNDLMKVMNSIVSSVQRGSVIGSTMTGRHRAAVRRALLRSIKAVTLCLAILGTAFSSRAQSVTIEAESGSLGADIAAGVDGSVTFVVNTNNNTDNGSPLIAGRVASYSVTFPAPGEYNLYARMRVGPQTYDDDSFFMANGFGTKIPDASGDWRRANGLASAGYTSMSDLVDGSGSAGSGVWKWVNLSQRSDVTSDPGITYTVTAGNLAGNTFQIGGREDGLEIDKLLFGLAANTFTVAELDAGGPGGGPPLPPFPPDMVAGDLVQFNENGAWCWYQDERAVVDQANGRILTGGVASGAGTGGSLRDAWVNAVVFDLQTGWPQRTELHRYSYTDDHNAPGFLIWPDGRTVAQYAGHNNDYLSRFRTLDGATWLPETSFDWTSVGAVNGEQTSYSNPHYLSAEGRAYTFVRCIDNRSPHFLVSSNLGSTWSYGGQLVEPDGVVGYNSGYFRYSDNGVDRIDFICTEGHPRDLHTSIYHGYISNGMSFQSDGTMVDTNVFDQLCPVSRDFTLVFSNGTELPPGMTNYRCWNSDVQHYADGTVQAIIHARINNDTGGNDSSIDPNHSFFFCRYDGTNWVTTYLCQAGTKMYSSEADYVGLGALSPNDPNTLFLSTRYDPRAVTPEVTDTNPPFADKREIWKGTTTNHGATFSWTPITQNSRRDNFRPIVPVWNEENIALFWFRGVYHTAQSFDAAIVGLIEQRSERVGLQTYVDATTANTSLATGGDLVLGPGMGQWHLRTTTGNNGSVMASADAVAENAPALKTTVTVPGAGTYDLWVNFWGDPVNGDWRVLAGMAPNQMQTFRQMACRTVQPGDHDSVLVLTNSSADFLYQAYVGRMSASVSNTLSVFVDDNAVVTGTTSTLGSDTTRTWYDGVSYAKVQEAEALRIQNVARSGPAAVTLIWNSMPPESLLPPQTFTVQKRDSLTDSSWTTLETGIPSAGSTTTFTDNSATSRTAFYRVTSP